MFALMFVVLLLSFTSAITYKQGQSVQLTTVCDNCTYVNLTSVSYGGEYLLLGQYSMTKNDTNYNYTFTNTGGIGEYSYVTCGDLNGILTCDDTLKRIFEVGTNSAWFLIIAFVLFYGLMIYSVRIKNPFMALISCFGLAILGLYTSFNGIGLYKDYLTSGISYVTIGVALGIGFEASRNLTGM